MKRSASPVAVQAEPAGPEVAPNVAHQALWFALAKRRLVSVVLVPTCAGGAAAGLANALVEVGQRLGDAPVMAVTAETVDYAFVARAADVVALTGGGTKRPSASPLEMIIAIGPVTVEPLGLAVVQAADGVVLCVERGRSSVSDVRKTIALIGRGKIVGSVLIA